MYGSTRARNSVNPARPYICLLMAAGEGSILAGPAGAIALMFNGGEGSSQSQQGCQRITQG